MSIVRCYAAYGERLASTLPLPELDEIPAGPARWTVREATALPAMQDAHPLGVEPIYGDVAARLFTHAGGHRITVDDTGAFDIERGNHHIVVAPRPGAWPDFVRAHLTGRVLATSLYLDGLLPLHASAVATRDGVIGFLAPKGFGKSSLALALAAAGAWLVSDDTLPVDADRALAWPGIHGLRVHDDSLGAVGVPGAAERTREGKHLITHLGRERIFARPMPLAALYLLAPVEPDGEGVDRERLAPRHAAVGLVAHVKVGKMFGASAAATMLERAARIAAAVPVHELHPPRDLAALPAVAAQLLDWHGRPEP